MYRTEPRFGQDSLSDHYLLPLSLGANYITTHMILSLPGIVTKSESWVQITFVLRAADLQ